MAKKENALAHLAHIRKLLRKLSEGDLTGWPNSKEQDVPKIVDRLNVCLVRAKMYLKILGVENDS